MTDNQQHELIVTAQNVRKNAYAPYSGFSVGAAVLGMSGRIYSGCNVENASYPVSMCAERGAISAAIAGGEKSLQAVAIASGSDQPCPPCGMCRQALAEFGPTMQVILVCSDGHIKNMLLQDLLPEMFGPGFLKTT